MSAPDKIASTIHYGFKRISPANVTELDNQPPHLFPKPNKKWVQECLKPQLDASVPDEVAFLYEAARGAMVYGQFFQPLTTLATEQCYRVLEAGARRRCADLGLLKPKRGKDKSLQIVGFAEILKALTTAGKIPKADLEYWPGMLFLRNRFSHPTSQSISAPKTALGVVAFTAGLLNRLFK